MANDAYQWFANGDHPGDFPPITDGMACPPVTYDADYQRANDWEGQVIRRYRGDDGTCRRCGEPMHAHGSLRTSACSAIVCPGDWIVTVGGAHRIITPFRRPNRQKPRPGA